MIDLDPVESGSEYSCARFSQMIWASQSPRDAIPSRRVDTATRMDIGQGRRGNGEMGEPVRKGGHLPARWTTIAVGRRFGILLFVSHLINEMPTA